MKIYYILPCIWLGFLISCDNASIETATKSQTSAVTSYIPEWAKDASIYEVNMRQFTAEGTFEAFSTHLNRIKDMGIEIIWLMPIHPISRKNRKGSLGSPYAVADYKGINPEFGTVEEFDYMVKKIHSLDMKIIIDWVPNHTGWDNTWISEHPEWYTQNDQGEIIDPIDYNTGKSWGWTDVADLNYESEAMRKEMIASMIYWIKQRDIDGFRMDVAHGVPDDFWIQASRALKKEGDIFLLAEGEVPKQRNEGGFHADYGWSAHHLLNEVAKGKANAQDIWEYYYEDTSKFQKGFHMMFTSNHDENTWAGTVFDRMGEAHRAMSVFTATFDGMPLIYGGQEEPLKHQLAFFEKDNIGFKNYEYQDFYTQLFKLKKENEALWNGEFGASPTIIDTKADVLSFERSKGDNSVKVYINFTSQEKNVPLLQDLSPENMKLTISESVDFEDGSLRLGPWGFAVYTK